jgi:hypothetical protein
MKNFVFSLMLVFLCSLFVSGCDLAQPKNKGKDDPPAVQNDPVPVEEPEATPVPENPGQDGDKTVTVPMAPGMSSKGNYGPPTGGPVDIITVPISTMFYAKDQLVINRITHAMNLYQATPGRFPASQEEFMENIIREHYIQLPPLPPGQEYVYDPMYGVLNIRKPR